MDDRELQRRVYAFTISFEPFVTALVDDIAAKIEEASRVAALDARASAAARDAAAVGVANVLSVVRVPGEFPAALPAASQRNVRLSILRGETLETVQRGYRLAHATFQEHVFRHAERTGADIATLRRITESLFAYYEWALPATADFYRREQARLPSEGDPAQYERVVHALDGSPPADLGYELEQTHVAVVLEAEDAERIVEAVGVALDAQTLTSVAPGGQTWGWLAGPGVTVAGVVAELESLSGHAGISEPERGPHGFAGAHRKAAIALRLGLLRDTPVSAYHDVALEALAFGGEEIAIDFARAELGRMADADSRVVTLRETLIEYFAQGGSTAATARALDIAERTVTYRLRRAEELIGRPLTERRADLETALRLYEILDVG